MKARARALPPCLFGLFFAGASVVGCAAPSADEPSSIGEDNLSTPAVVHFAAGRTEVSGALVSGRSIRVVYDENREPSCRGTQGGAAAYSVTGYYRIDGGAVRSFPAAGHRPDGSTAPVTLALPNTYANHVEFWFEQSNIWGCHAWDSNDGQNFVFDIGKPSGAANWAGQTKVISSRETCDSGSACESAWQPLGGEPFVYDTWTRQRAAIRQVSFEVYKPGVTDRDNPNLWRDLDVQLFSRIGRSGAFQKSYVNFQKRIGNNARYAVETRTMDPFAMQNTPTRTSECPKFPFERTGGAGPAYVESTVEFYFRIGSVELRPDPSDPKSVFRGRFVEYDRFTICPSR